MFLTEGNIYKYPQNAMNQLLHCPKMYKMENNNGHMEWTGWVNGYHSY